MPFHRMTGPYGPNPTRNWRAWVPIDDTNTFVIGLTFHPLCPLTPSNATQPRVVQAFGISHPSGASPFRRNRTDAGVLSRISRTISSSTARCRRPRRTRASPSFGPRTPGLSSAWVPFATGRRSTSAPLSHHRRPAEVDSLREGVRERWDYPARGPRSRDVHGAGRRGYHPSVGVLV